ncbi:NUDIX hydrolase [Amycolatopsis sp. YIM 10]|uniref:NUDIX hydrolase n=1 Tax=Amycolatopsis sp. YIM 10 TaxID=2653857 RepID=UPI001D15ABC1|nr:NUDIX domain-containing protein [Amycolatopsis sp. YIM 10]
MLLARYVPPTGETNRTLPGGRVEHGEDPFDAVIREVAERRAWPTSAPECRRLLPGPDHRRRTPARVERRDRRVGLDADPRRRSLASHRWHDAADEGTPRSAKPSEMTSTPGSAPAANMTPSSTSTAHSPHPPTRSNSTRPEGTDWHVRGPRPAWR